MLNVVKKVWSWAKRVYVSATTVREEIPVYENTSNVVTFKGPDYWSEYSRKIQAANKAIQEFEEMEARIHQFYEKQSRIAQMTDEDSLRMWRENNQQVDAYFQKQRKPRLRVVASA